MVDREIEGKLRQLLPDLAVLGVRTIRIFGSAATGTMAPGSDVDLLAEFEPDKVQNYFEVLFLLEDTLGKSVDLATPATLHNRIRNRILNEAILVA